MGKIQFASLEWGGKGGQTVVLLHGLFGRKEEWKRIGEALADEYHLLALDMPNHGGTSAMAEMNYGNMANSVAEELKIRGLSNVIILAHSMSGRVSAAMAQRYPELVKKLMILDSPPIGPFVPQNVKKDMLDSVAAIRESKEHRFDSPEALRSFMLERVQEPMVVDYISTHYSFDAKNPGWQVGVEGIENFMNNWIQEEIPGGVPCPYLMLKGGASPYSAPFTHEMLKSWKSDGQMVVIEGVGHFVHFQARKEVLEHFRTFAKQV
ncbi:MAG: hypothetical protein CSA07_05455 [Bacteroidia bacterium]|nr:MAG: hypothetical protein CSA07_05455 [Bacteroidia bacterium]